jgi:O-acetyl-ADP-ribose deacetylase (regulator of RNase III)
MENGVKTIAFPSISTGVYGYPVDKAAKTAVRAVIEFLESNPGSFEAVIFCGFDGRTESEYARALGEAVQK